MAPSVEGALQIKFHFIVIFTFVFRIAFKLIDLVAYSACIKINSREKRNNDLVGAQRVALVLND